MAKAKMTKVSEKVKSQTKISDEQLETLKNLQGKLNNILLNLGNADLAKQSMLSAHAELKVEWDAMTKELENEFGQVNISLEDGSVSPILEEA
jgi:hypothetical protein|tara:strand:+ start:93 stop:371 length:279 start_codon:yes stop_codon:yes gene_type:complete